MNMNEEKLIKKVSGMSISDLDSGSDEEIDEKTNSLTDEEIKAKLKLFSKVDRGLDESVEDVVGKLLVNEEDEKAYADEETWWKLYKMIGGFWTLFQLGLTLIVFRCFELFRQSAAQEWSDVSPEE